MQSGHGKQVRPLKNRISRISSGTNTSVSANPMSMKTLLKFIKKFALWVLGLTGAFALTAFAMSVISVSEKPVSCDRKTTIYLQYSPIHADIVLPADLLSPETLARVKLPSHPDYYVFGLGDRDIYLNTPTWADLKARYALKALLLPSKRAVHLEPAHDVYENWVPLEVCDSQRQDLEDYVMASIKQDDDGRLQIIEGMTYTGADVFYEAPGIYTMFSSCNNWVNGAMKIMGFKTSLWSPFSQGVIHHAKKQSAKADDTAFAKDVGVKP